MTQWGSIHLPMQKIRVQSLGQEDPLEKEMATHSSILAWEIPWTEEPGGLQSMGSQRVTLAWRILWTGEPGGLQSMGAAKSRTQLSTHAWQASAWTS